MNFSDPYHVALALIAMAVLVTIYRVYEYRQYAQIKRELLIMDQIEGLKKHTTNGVHSERPEITDDYPYLSVKTEIWSPCIYSLSTIEEDLNLAFCGELDGEYIFRSTT